MKKALVTLAIGQFHRIYELTAPRMREYAEQIGAEHLVITETQQHPAHFAKFDLITRLADEGYDAALYLDADIYIRRAAPDIFEHFSSAAFSEFPHPEPAWVQQAIRWIRRNLAGDWPGDRYFNTGVLVLDKQSLTELATRIAEVQPVTGIYWEQDQLNVLMRNAGVPHQVLPACWNQFCSQVWFTPAKAVAAYFLHATGATLENKLRQLQELIADYP